MKKNIIAYSIAALLSTQAYPTLAGGVVEVGGNFDRGLAPNRANTGYCIRIGNKFDCNLVDTDGSIREERRGNRPEQGGIVPLQKNGYGLGGVDEQIAPHGVNSNRGGASINGKVIPGGFTSHRGGVHTCIGVIGCGR
ncbi:MAG: hypothetical protein ABTQ34_04700 [Bdellovibrionales bacterium]